MYRHMQKIYVPQKIILKYSRCGAYTSVGDKKKQRIPDILRRDKWEHLLGEVQLSSVQRVPISSTHFNLLTSKRGTHEILTHVYFCAQFINRHISNLLVSGSLRLLVSGSMRDDCGGLVGVNLVVWCGGFAAAADKWRCNQASRNQYQ